MFGAPPRPGRGRFIDPTEVSWSCSYCVCAVTIISRGKIHHETCVNGARPYPPRVFPDVRQGGAGKTLEDHWRFHDRGREAHACGPVRLPPRSGGTELRT